MLLASLFKKKHFAIFLVLTVLAAQWVGVQHRVVHARAVPLAQSSTTVSPFSANWGDPAHHSCATFDAAAVGAAIASACLTASVLQNAHILALWVAYSSWRAPHLSHFSSRAPPA